MQVLLSYFCKNKWIVANCWIKRDRYQVDEVKYDDELEEYLKEVKPEEIHVYFGVDPDSGLTLAQPD